MADNTTLNTGTGGDVISTDDLGTVKVQRVKVQYGVDGSASDVSTGNPLPVVPVVTLATGTIGALNANVAITLNGGTSAGFYITTTLNGTLKGQYSYDNTNWLDGVIQYNGSTTTGSSVAIASSVQSGVIYVPAGSVYCRLICSAYTSGSSTATVAAANSSTVVRIGDGGAGTSGSAAIKPASTGAATTDPSLVVALSPNSPTKIFDGTNTATVKAASTAAVAGDTALVVALSPNNNTLSNALITKLSDGTNTSAVKAASTAAVAADPALVVALSPNNNTLSNALLVKTTDGTNTAAVKAASTAASATDPALVVAISPNNSVSLASGPIDVTASGTLGSLNAAVQINASGLVGIGMQLAAGTLVGTIVPEVSYDNGTTWNATYFDPPSGNKVSSFVFGSSNTATAASFIAVGGGNLYRVRVSAYTSGTASVSLRASTVIDPSILFGGTPGNTTQPPVAAQVAGWDGTTYRVPVVKAGSTAAVAGDQALVVTISPNNSVSLASGPVDITASGTLGSLNAAVQVNASGLQGVGMQLAAGTLVGTIIPEASFDNGTTWNATYFDSPAGNIVSSFVFGSSNTATAVSIIPVGGANLYRVRVSAYTSGTASATLRGSSVADPSILFGGTPGSTTQPAVASQVAGWDGTTYRVPVVKAGSTAAVAGDQALVVALSPNNNTLANALITKVSDGTNTSAVKAASTAAAATDPALVVALSPNNNTLANALLVKATDGTNTAAVKASATAAATTDPSLVVAISPNNNTYIKDNNAFTDGTTYLDMAGFIFDEVAGTALTENDAAAGRIDSKRAIVNVIEDATTRGTRATVKAASTAAVAADPAFVVALSPNNNTLANALITKVSDGTNTAAVKAASTAAAATDAALVVAVSPNNTLKVAAGAGQSATGTVTSVAGAITNTTILASNTARIGATVYNESTAVLYLKLGSTASTTSYTIQVAASGYYEVPFGYNGILTGVWASATGNARVTEMT